MHVRCGQFHIPQGRNLELAVVFRQMRNTRSARIGIVDIETDVLECMVGEKRCFVAGGTLTLIRKEYCLSPYLLLRKCIGNPLVLILIKARIPADQCPFETGNGTAYSECIRLSFICLSEHPFIYFISFNPFKKTRNTEIHFFHGEDGLLRLQFECLHSSIMKEIGGETNIRERWRIAQPDRPVHSDGNGNTICKRLFLLMARTAGNGRIEGKQWFVEELSAQFHAGLGQLILRRNFHCWKPIRNIQRIRNHRVFRTTEKQKRTPDQDRNAFQ